MDNDIDRILNSIDGISPASPSPYFYDKLLRKLNTTEKNIWERWSGFIARPAVLIAGFVLIVMLNLSTIILGKQKALNQQAGVDADDYEQLSYGASTYFDYENGMP